MAPALIRVQEEDFDPGAEVEALRSPSCGAIVSFVGIARDFSGRPDTGRSPVDRSGVDRSGVDRSDVDRSDVDYMVLEHYPGMTERSLEHIAAQALTRWDLQAVRIIHRYGKLYAGDRIVLVVTASAHRDAAFDSCRFLIDFLKTEAPFWKKEFGSGGGRWVEARRSDLAARERWLEAPAAAKTPE